MQEVISTDLNPKLSEFNKSLQLVFILFKSHMWMDSCCFEQMSLDACGPPSLPRCGKQQKQEPRSTLMQQKKKPELRPPLRHFLYTTPPQATNQH